MGLGHKGTTKSGGQKDALDRFYTSVDEARHLVDTIAPSLPKLVIEPSAGKGAFVLALEDASFTVLAYDIEPDSNPVCKTPIVKTDFLSLRAQDILSAHADYDRSTTAFVGNPPFGVQGRIATQFVHHCLELADDAWMILPPSFRKASMADKVGNGELREVIDLTDTTYATPVGTVNVPSFMMHWHACDGREAKARRRRDEGNALMALPFEFLAWSDAPTSCDSRCFTIRRVGGTAGTASISTDVSAQTNYLCKTKDGHEATDIIAWINQTDFPERDWSVGPRSLSKGEVALRLMRHPLA